MMRKAIRGLLLLALSAVACSGGEEPVAENSTPGRDAASEPPPVDAKSDATTDSAQSTKDARPEPLDTSAAADTATADASAVLDVAIDQIPTQSDAGAASRDAAQADAPEPNERPPVDAATAADAGNPPVFRCHLFADLSPGSGTSFPHYLTASNNQLFFLANDGQHGKELFRTDGTKAGTRMVVDLNPGPADGLISTQMAVVSGYVYFSGTDGTHGYEVWRSDGTSEGTTMVKDSVPGTESLFPLDFTAGASQVFFIGHEPNEANAVYRSDGTSVGTFRLAPPYALDSTDAYEKYLAVAGPYLFFSSFDSTHGREPWRSDGTLAGTAVLKDIGSAANSSSARPPLFWPVGNRVYFGANDGQTGMELWVSDGTETGTRLAADINPGTGASDPVELKLAGGVVFLQASDGVHGSELFRTDGTQQGTSLVKDIAAGTDSSYPSGFVGVDGQALFEAWESAGGYELYRTDGTAAGTYRVKDIHPGKSDSKPWEITALGGSFYFSADDGTHGRELWRTDGTAAGTYLVEDINLGAPHGYPQWFAVFQNALWMQATDDWHGEELWRCALELDTGDVPDAGGDPNASCPGTAPPAMVRVGNYCIDSTEVTNAEYAAFLAAKGSDVSGQPGYCTFNSTYQPAVSALCAASLYDPVNRADYPVVCVDWCDAYAYCAWAGKRLCGATDGGHGSTFLEAGDDEWTNACSAGGTLEYPYGNTYEARRCPESSTMAPVLSRPLCQGGFAGLYGMGDNAWEWVDNCNLYGGADDSCDARGAGGKSCIEDGGGHRGTTSNLVGIRCCAGGYVY